MNAQQIVSRSINTCQDVLLRARNAKPWISVQNVTVIHLIVIETSDSGPMCWTDIPGARAAGV